MRPKSVILVDGNLCLTKRACVLSKVVKKLTCLEFYLIVLLWIIGSTILVHFNLYGPHKLLIVHKRYPQSHIEKVIIELILLRPLRNL